MTTDHAEKQYASPHAPSPGAGKAAQSESLNSDTLFSEGESRHKPKRTLGLRIFDATFYGGLVNTAIFLASAASTYWTYHGNTVGKPGSVLRWIGEAFHKRRKLIETALETIGIKGEAGKIGTTVFWSFFDGTLFAPLIKVIEDRREKIALSIDTVLGTKSDNMRAYDAEPKQSWKSVIAGRLETLGIVLPVAIIMEKTGGNKRIFYDGGEKMMAFAKKHLPTVDNKITSLVSAPHAPEHLAELATRKKSLWHVLSFEAFYTSICTIGTYLFSRGFARHHPNPEKEPHEYMANNGGSGPKDEAPETVPSNAASPDKPAASITHPTLMARVAEPMPAAALST